MKKLWNKLLQVKWCISIILGIIFFLILYSSNLFKNRDLTEIWLTFIQEILSSLFSWPVAAVIIFLKFRDPIILLIERINNLKIGDYEFNFSKTLKEIEKELDAEDSNLQGEYDNDELSEEYQELASIEPQMAILRSWIDYEKLLRIKFNQLIQSKKLDFYYPGQKFISVAEMMLQLSKQGLIKKNIYKFSKELNFLRNSIIHGQEVEVTTEMALEYNRTLSKLMKIIEEL